MSVSKEHKKKFLAVVKIFTIFYFVSLVAVIFTDQFKSFLLGDVSSGKIVPLDFILAYIPTYFYLKAEPKFSRAQAAIILGLALPVLGVVYSEFASLVVPGVLFRESGLSKIIGIFVQSWVFLAVFWIGDTVLKGTGGNGRG